MKNQHLIFQREGQNIRVIKDESGEPLFCLSDICKNLEHSNSRSVAEAIKEEFELCNLKLHPFQTQRGVQNFTMITEPQLYFMLMRSDKPKAKEFRQWVINEVLPSIRKSGSYSLNERKDDGLNNLHLMQKLLKTQEEFNQTQSELIKTQKEMLEMLKENKSYQQQTKHDNLKNENSHHNNLDTLYYELRKLVNKWAESELDKNYKRAWKNIYCEFKNNFTAFKNRKINIDDIRSDINHLNFLIDFCQNKLNSKE